MGKYDSCRLLSIVLYNCVINPFTNKASIDFDLLHKISYQAMRIADDIVDLEIEAIDRILSVVDNSLEAELWNKLKNTALQGRRAGVGFTGLADMLAMLGLQYGSKESIDIIEQVMFVIQQAQLKSTIDMAIERGAFLSYNEDNDWEFGGSHTTLKRGKNEWYDNLLDKHTELCEKMSIYGRRNISWSTVAPTGTVSLMAGCTSGIEPLFAPYYVRRRKCMSDNDRVDYVDSVGQKYTEFVVVHPKLKEYIKIKYPFLTNDELTERFDDIEYLKEVFSKSPYYNSTAPDIKWEDRIKVQSVIQKYTTHAISSTINLPKETTVEEISDMYIEAWKSNLKGLTVYRDGCREGILNKVGEVKEVGREAPKRPKTLEADYYQIKRGGKNFVVLVGLLNNNPYEIFAFELLNSVKIENHKGIITKVKKGHYEFKSEFITLSDLQLANSNIEEKAATLYTSMLLRHGANLEFIIKTAKKVNDNISSFSSAMCRVLSGYISKQELKGEVCPECGGKLIRENGCIKCNDCGHSKCLMMISKIY